MHPTARLLLYVISALALPGLNLFGLGALGVLILLVQAIHFWRGLRAGLRLLWRTKWLFAVMFVAYAYALPGAPAIPALGGYTPSQEGMAAAAVQIVRLAVLLLLLEWMVLRMGIAEIVSGLYPILARFAPLGVPAERATVRLALTLSAIEARRAAGQRRWRWPPDLDELALPAYISLSPRPWRAIDRWAVALGGIGLTAVWLCALL